MDPETFSSELRGVHERRVADRDSFHEEFRGASDSLIAKDRPELVGGRGRGAVVAMAVTLMLPVLIGGGLALWYWAVPIGHWLAGDAPRADAAVEAEPEAQAPVASPNPEPPPQPEVEKVFGIRGAPDGEAPDPTPEPVQPDVPVQPPAQPVQPPVQPDLPAQPPVQPNPSGGKLEAISTNVRGNVGSTAVNASLDKLDAALLDCWAKAGASGSIELELSFGITRDGTLHAISLGGGSETLHACVRASVPLRGWPVPQGEASVSRTWKLGG